MVPAERAAIRPSWDVAGLRGTGSDTVVIPRQQIPAEWTIPLPVPLDQPLTTSEPIGCAGRGLWPTAFAVAATQLGIARRALDEIAQFARSKKRPFEPAPLVQEQAFIRDLMEAETTWQAASASAEAQLEHLWELATAGIPLNAETRANARLAATHVAQVGTDLVRTCFDLAGAGAIGRQHPLARCYRDGTILCHHAAANRRTYDLIGRVRLGLEPDSALV
jgi:alkylation response protein AidB-like acyl-CoA dehydrogenase